MPDEVDIPTDTLQDKIDEVKEELDKAERRAKEAPWINYLAVTTALMAVLAAISALLSGQTSDEALLRANDAVFYQAVAVDAWGEYQADSIKAVDETNAAAILSQLKAPAATVAGHTAEAARRKANQRADQAAATQAEAERDRSREESGVQGQRHDRFALAVTLFQVGIGLSAVAALLRRKPVWYASLAGAAIGIALLIWGFAPVAAPVRPEGAATPAAALTPGAGGATSTRAAP